jgi:3-hydroxybutyryl-CoA dehydrogenase
VRIVAINYIKNVTIIGAGTMGHSIAQVYSQGLFNVTLVDVHESILEKARMLISENLETLKEFDYISDQEQSKVLDRISYTTNLKKAIEKADLVIEAVNEIPELKKRVFNECDKYCSKNAMLVSNTSGLNIFDLVAISNPERLIIHHWFAPPHIIPLVEIVKGPQTSEVITELSVALLKKLGKKPLVINQYMDNFIVNRIQNVISVQVYEMIAKGWATPEQIDYAIKTSLGIRLPIVGIVQTQDFTGLDLVLDVQKRYRMNQRYPQVESMVNQGNLGAKTGRGWYDYGNREEKEILKERDRRYLKILRDLQELNAFEPI